MNKYVYDADVAILIGELGGVDICFGGIGINGHLAFNEGQMGEGQWCKDIWNRDRWNKDKWCKVRWSDKDACMLKHIL